MKKRLLSLMILNLVGLAFYQCSEKSPQAPAKFNLTQSTGCVGCHTNADQLKQLALPLPPPAESGEG